MHRLSHSHHSEGGVRHVGSLHRGHHAARLPDLQCHVCVHGGFSGLPGQVSDRIVLKSVDSMVAKLSHGFIVFEIICVYLFCAFF